MSVRSHDVEHSSLQRDVALGPVFRGVGLEQWMAALVHTNLQLVAAEYTESAGWQQCTLADLLYCSTQRQSHPRIMMRPGCPGVFSAIQLWDDKACWGALFLDRNVQIDELRAWSLLLSAAFDLDSAMNFASEEHYPAC